MNKVLSIFLFLLAATSAEFSMAETSDLLILGWVESAFLADVQLELKAKLDTGAETSSLDARILKKFRKSGKRWVRFAIADRESGEEFVLVRERVRTVSVVQHDGEHQVRPVVMLRICIAGHWHDTEVSLIDRSEFNYQLLLGRSALASFALVDPGSTFLGQSGCAEPAGGEGEQ